MASELLRHHGDLDEGERRALGVDVDTLLDFSVNVSDLGPSPRVRDAILGSDHARYPDRAMLDAREALARATSRSIDEVRIGAGAVELLWAAVRAFAEPGDAMMVLGPTFTEPTAAALAARLRVQEHRAPSPDFDFEASELRARLARERPRLVSLSRPCNPTGRAIPFDALVRLIAEAEATTFLVDESFLSLSELHAEATRDLPANALRFRSMTKDHALAGIRLGYVLGTPDRLARLDAQRPPWLVSRPALAACRAAAEDAEHVAEVRDVLLGRRRALTARLVDAGYRVVPSTTSFVLCELGQSDALRGTLLTRYGILVRSATSFELPDHVRLAARPEAEVTRLLEALRAERPR